MRTYSIELYEKERNRRVTYTAEPLHMQTVFCAFAIAHSEM